MNDYAADLKTALGTLRAKAVAHGPFFAYYRGDHPSVYAASRLSSVFRQIDVHFAENWCAPVIDTLLDRLNLHGIKGPAASQDVLDAFWAREQVGIESHETASDVAVCGESYVIVWPDDQEIVRSYRNKPEMCHIWYDPDKPRVKIRAAKWWLDEDKAAKRHVTLYYPDEFVHFVSRGKGAEARSERSFEMEADPEPNERGIIPVFHLRSHTSTISGELQNALPVQMAINRVADDMMVASEYSAFKQRWAISGADPGDLRAAPGTTIVIPPAPADEQAVSVGEFTATELPNYIAAIEHLANAMAAITRTPKNFFFQAAGGNVSGDALIAMEAQLAKKAAYYQARLGVTWREIAAFVCLLAGQKVPSEDIEAVWSEQRTVQPVAEATALAQMVAAGVPLKTALRRQGWNQADLDQLDKDAAEVSSSKTNLAAQMLAQARAKLNQGGVPA